MVYTERRHDDDDNEAAMKIDSSSRLAAINCHVPPGQTHQTRASASHEAGTPEAFDLAVDSNSLRPGRNVLAIEVHNREDDSGDLSVIPEVLLWAATQPGGQSDKATE